MCHVLNNWWFIVLYSLQCMWCSECEVKSILISRSFFVSFHHRSHAFFRHFNNGNAVPMHSGGFLTLGTAFPCIPPRNDPCYGKDQFGFRKVRSLCLLHWLRKSLWLCRLSKTNGSTANHRCRLERQEIDLEPIQPTVSLC